MKIDQVKVGDVVVDLWWQHRTGKVIKVYSKTVNVEWNDNYEKWVYDEEHLVFLVKRKF